MKGKLIWIVVIVAFLIRFVSLTSFPAGFNADEASFGYDAYSLMHTGRDQWGTFLPIVLKSFGDYKAPVYSYLAIPSIAAFGLNVFSTRLPNVFVGALSVYIIYLLSKKLSNSENIAILAALLLTFNPWGIMLSRGAIESNLITFFLPLGIYLFLQKRYWLAALVFGINMFTYHSAKLITPIVTIGLLIIFHKEVFRTGIKNLITPAIIFLIFSFGVLYTFKIGGGVRIAERSITDGALEQGFQQRMQAISKGQSQFISKLVHNKYEVIAARFIGNYLQYFSPRFLFMKGVGDGSYGMIPGIPVIYIFEGLLFLGAVPLLIFDLKRRNLIILLILWLLLAPVPGALASGIGYSGNRASGMLPVIQILEAFGSIGWYFVLRKLNVKILYIISVPVIILAVFEMANFFKSYFKTPNDSILAEMDYGNLDMATWLDQNHGNREIILSRSLSEPQIFLAFADQWDPDDYQLNSSKWLVKTWVDQIPEYSLGTYTIKSVDWKKDILSRSLIASKVSEVPSNQVPIKVFNFPDSKPNIYIVDAIQKFYAKAD